MRKALILLVVFAVVGAAAFADGATAKWTVSSLYGFGIVSPSGGDMALKPFDWSHEGIGRTRLVFTYTAADGNAGFNSRLEKSGFAVKTTSLTSDDPTSAATLEPFAAYATVKNAVVFNQMNGWAKLFGGMLTVRGGILDDYTIATKDWMCYGNTDGALGLFFDVTPMAGLDIGFFQVIPAVSQTNVTDGDNIGFSFAIPDVGSVQAGITLQSEKTATTGMKVYGGFQYSAMKDLTAIVELGATMADGATLIGVIENVGYAMGALTVGARIGEYSDGTDFRWGIEPTVAYKVDDNVTVNAIVNAYNAPRNDDLIWSSGALYAGTIGAGAAGDTSFGAGASVTYAIDGFKLVIGDFFGAATDVGGNVLYVNADLSL